MLEGPVRARLLVDAASEPSNDKHNMEMQQWPINEETLHVVETREKKDRGGFS